MVGTSVLTRPTLCSKSAIFREVWYIVNHALDLLRHQYHTSELSNNVYNFVLAQGAQKLQLQVQTNIRFTKENGDI